MDKVRHNKGAAIILLLPAIILFVSIIIIPIICSGYYSLTEWDGIRDKVFIGFSNYRELFEGEVLRGSIKNMLLLALCAVGIQLPLALVFAILISGGIKGEKMYMTVFFIPVMLSTVVIGQLWLKIYNPSHGLLNGILSMIGLENYADSWLGNQGKVLAAVFVPMIWQYVGYHMLLMYAGIKSINSEIIEAAKIDGANGFQIACRITIPMLMPVLEVCTIFAVTGAFKSFDLIYILTGGGPAHASEVPSTLMFTEIFQKNHYGVGSAIAIFIILICFTSAIIIKRIFKRWEV
ncbi:sugar ABC transporter permease [Butyrivibrio sp. X503]|uniref:carbohydrate ABC transporter permease n=1 Tax=unclassified Butyrivibrio TaxID=2639466 RepID=UPI000EA98B03|nr:MULTISPECIES: sugar ABC transporter permease [unclassified Butyrivibrio]MBR4669293.1 sugar ABC transporter permease [Butyrivibrio sp.]RKM55235.1 sugar ABC transporter permease [Butyrivibrio sp. X503]RKM57658.1 sugar ABC transporter permease [Butyrivibrio sp. XB500-5]